MTESTSPRPPFRADHVGSLLRPEKLQKARRRWQEGKIGDSDLRRIEDESIRDAVSMQEEVGLKAITDGDFRRDDWFLDFMYRFDGPEPSDETLPVHFTGGESFMLPRMVITKKIAYPEGGIARADVAFLNAATRETAKVCMPAPTMFHPTTERDATFLPEAYPDPQEFWDHDLGKAYNDAFMDYYAAGCRYIQLDDVNSCLLCDPNVRANRQAQGLEPDALLDFNIRLINSAVADRPDDLTVAVHLCRGNYKSEYAGAGGYDYIAERYFSGLDVDGFFMEFDDERAGDFAPLRYVPKDKTVVLGLVSSKFAALEPKDELKRRVEDASRHIDIDQLAISPQCGFASTQEGNRLSLDDERRKLAHVVEVAAEIWGG